MAGFNYLSIGLVRVFEISHMGKNNGNPDQVCEKKKNPNLVVSHRCMRTAERVVSAYKYHNPF